MSLRGALWDPLLRPVAVLGQREGAEGCVALIVSKKEAEEMTAGWREEQRPRGRHLQKVKGPKHKRIWLSGEQENMISAQSQWPNESGVCKKVK